ncbi:homoserine kinase [Actinopolymorpha pittospori]|uniref:Homoserine kinase n=1 Tax=Actinopolymorpha pittospori TaxID=648752 RepID=A0A927NB51_9ACTN|nr:homoserine kinase [Actinopolymorpha pittospori]MBE1611605.1 homoserine kinase [Actinopolymorpha pittospori]
MGTPAFRPEPVRVRVPATSANLGPGFDALGLALGLYDEVEVAVAPEGLRISVHGHGAGEVPEDDSHLVVRALRTTLERVGGQPPGLTLTCTNRIPHGRGMGSSAAAIVAGVVAARALVPESADHLDEAEMLALATKLEGHPDNVAACLRGGLTVAWTDAQAIAHAVRLEPAPFDPVLFVPETPVSTHAARGLLPALVPHGDAALNAGRAALLVAALTSMASREGDRASQEGDRVPGNGSGAGGVDIDLLMAATEDRLHQSYRVPAMPGSAALVADLRAHGHPAVVSGAGPTVLAFAHAGQGEELRTHAPEGYVVHLLPLDRSGARVLIGGAGNEGPGKDVVQRGEARSERFC